MLVQGPAAYKAAKLPVIVSHFTQPTYYYLKCHALESGKLIVAVSDCPMNTYATTMVAPTTDN